MNLQGMLLFIPLLLSSLSFSMPLSPDQGDSWISVEAQVGYTFNKGWFYGGQTSYNTAFNDDGLIIGGTIGLRKQRGEFATYVDLQSSLLRVLGVGIGINLASQNDINLSYDGIRVKGWFDIATADAVISEQNEYSLGLLVGYPFQLIDNEPAQ